QVDENPFIEWNESPPISRAPSSALSTHDIITATAREEKDLSHFLVEQLAMLQISTPLKRVIEFIIYSIDEDGYFRMDEAEVLHNLGISNDLYEKAMQIIHQMEPIGVGARSLVECLLLQAKQLAKEDDLLHRLIEDHLDD